MSPSSSRTSPPNLDPKRAVLYLRASTRRQELSPSAQREMVAEWARAKGIEVVAEFLDHGVSGATELAERPGLMKALQSLQDLDAGVVVVAKRDRLGRSVEVLVLVEREIRRLGARVMAADTSNDDAPSARFMRRVLDAVAEHERDLIRARTRAALDVRRARGLRTGSVPLGFTCDEAGQLVVDIKERRATGLARRLREEGLSLRAVAERLDEAGHRTRSGSPWHPEQIRRLLRLRRR
ncbi:MAG: recombinase family protein [Myxococcota bacterium]